MTNHTPTPTPDDLVIHQDAHVLVINKPSGLAVQAGRGLTESLEDHLRPFAKSKGRMPKLVHRLDRGTSGVMVVARTKPAAAFLSDAFARRQVQKTYWAVVAGTLPQPSGTLDHPLRRQNNRQGGPDLMQVCDANAEGAQDARTTYRTLAVGDGLSLLACQPKTGRMHQIRVHLAHAGCPIVGDPLYGGPIWPESARLHLHAYRLACDHPGGGTLEGVVPPPADLQAAWRDRGLTLPTEMVTRPQVVLETPA